MRDAKSLTTLLNLIANGVEVEPATKARLVAEAEDILKAKHDGRKDIATGKFHEMTRPAQTLVPGTGIPVTHMDTREGLAAELLGGGKHEPTDDGTLPVTPYDYEPGDGHGRTHARSLPVTPPDAKPGTVRFLYEQGKE